MFTSSKTTQITWYGQEHTVKIYWELEYGDFVTITCTVDGKEIVRMFRNKWTGKKGKRYDDSHFYKLKRCCNDGFKYPRDYPAAFMPIFSILHGEEL